MEGNQILVDIAILANITDMVRRVSIEAIETAEVIEESAALAVNEITATKLVASEIITYVGGNEDDQ